MQEYIRISYSCKHLLFPKLFLNNWDRLFSGPGDKASECGGLRGSKGSKIHILHRRSNFCNIFAGITIAIEEEGEREEE